MMGLLERSWYRKQWWSMLLWPLSLVFRALVAVRRAVLSRIARQHPHPRPVVIIGNVTVGGTGKTPLVIRLARELKAAGMKPGIVSRGYGGRGGEFPLRVVAETDPVECGDEAVLIAQLTGCPVRVDPDRERAYQALCEQESIDVVLADDGLQHYRLCRDLEIAVIDGYRMFGNGMCLPAGPLREPVARLASVRYLVINGGGGDSPADPLLHDAVAMVVRPRYLVNLLSGERKPINGAPFRMGATVHAVSGIGNPDRFLDALQKLPYALVRHDFPDHHPFKESDISTIDEFQPIVMTEKDAVKCRRFAKPNFWYLATETELPGSFIEAVVRDVQCLVDASKATNNQGY